MVTTSIQRWILSTFVDVQNPAYKCAEQNFLRIVMSLKKIIFSVLWIFPFFGFVLGYVFTHMLFHTKEITAPNFIGSSLQNVVKKASSLGINIRILREKVGSDIEEGIVLEQIPKPLHAIKPNQYVFVTLSKYPEGIVVPELVDKDQRSVIQICRDLGIQPQIFWVRSSYPKNFCVAQSPQPGEKLEKPSALIEGAHKNLLIVYFSSGKNKLFVVPDLKKKPLFLAKEFLEQEGIDVKIYHSSDVEKDHKCEHCVVSGQQPMAGSIVDGSKKIYMQLQVSSLKKVVPSRDDFL